MKNLFDSDNYPDSVPEELHVGERWAWTNSEITATYPTSLYTLRFRMCLQKSSHQAINITASKTGSKHIVEVGQSTTSSYTLGLYWWQAVIVRDSDSEELVVADGYLDVLADLDDHTGDTRTHNYKVLQAIQATIEGTATKDQSNYSVAGRSLSRRPISELLELKKEYQRLWEADLKKIKRKNGKPVRDRTVFKMSS